MSMKKKNHARNRTYTFNPKQLEEYGYILRDLKDTDFAIRESLQRFDMCRNVLLDIKSDKEVWERCSKALQDKLLDVMELHNIELKGMPKRVVKIKLMDKN